jgi:hypothetical protein
MIQPDSQVFPCSDWLLDEDSLATVQTGNYIMRKVEALGARSDEGLVAGHHAQIVSSMPPSLWFFRIVFGPLFSV